MEKIKEEPEKEDGVEDDEDDEEEEEEEEESARRRNGDLKRGSSHKKPSVFSFKFGRLTEGDNVTGGWPAWLVAVAGEAIHGWQPLRSDSFKRLEKVIIIYLMSSSL